MIRQLGVVRRSGPKVVPESNRTPLFHWSVAGGVAANTCCPRVNKAFNSLRRSLRTQDGHRPGHRRRSGSPRSDDRHFIRLLKVTRQTREFQLRVVSSSLPQFEKGLTVLADEKHSEGPFAPRGAADTAYVRSPFTFRIVRDGTRLRPISPPRGVVSGDNPEVRLFRDVPVLAPHRKAPSHSLTILRLVNCDATPSSDRDTLHDEERDDGDKRSRYRQ